VRLEKFNEATFEDVVPCLRLELASKSAGNKLLKQISPHAHRAVQ
jgi:hypothetical protein